MHEQVAIKCSSIQKAPTVCKSTNVASVPLPKTVRRFPADDGFQSNSVGSSPLIGLHVELDSLLLFEFIILAFQHNAFCFEA